MKIKTKKTTLIGLLIVIAVSIFVFISNYSKYLDIPTNLGKQLNYFSLTMISIFAIALFIGTFFVDLGNLSQKKTKRLFMTIGIFFFILIITNIVLLIMHSIQLEQSDSTMILVSVIALIVLLIFISINTLNILIKISKKWIQ